jgi:hypothetical protein
MKKILFFILFSNYIFLAFSQIDESKKYKEYNPQPLSLFDSIKLSNIPSLYIPDNYKTQTLILPVFVDNSTKIYFRPVTYQSGYECGQTAGQAFMFTYEIDRLRNLSALLPDNQYPTHFAWNFYNNAYNYTGVSFFESWEVTRVCGTPNVTDYGGALNTGGEKRWMTGYQKYYNAMKNRLDGVYSIRCDSPEGVYNLKAWLFDHLEGSTTGGLAGFYAQYCSPNTTLPTGTPEAGKALISTWGNSPSHAWTIVGYNDSIRFDFNGDGQYTNNIDINGDGVVNVKDWEIGGLKIVNGYAGTSWGNSGFSYMMYKALADGISNGGIWNSTVYVINAKQNQNPQMTFKINLKHNRRNQVKVIAGVSQNINDIRPAYRMEFPIFNYQGASIGMLGDTIESAQTIEFGLDISPLLSYIDVGTQAKFFLEIIEKDPTNIGSGILNSFSLMDYTSTSPIETPFNSTNNALNHNDTSRFSIIKPVVFNKILINQDSLFAKIYSTYNHQLTANYGQQPYKWSLYLDYNESIVNAAFPASLPITLNTGNSGYAVQNLNFNFPFFGKSYNQIFVYADGFIKFDNSLYTFPYLIDADLLFRSHRIIAPFYADLVYGTGQKVSYEAGNDYALISWKAGVSGQSSSYVNVALKLFSNGKIEFYYGNININSSWISALSGGDLVNYYYTGLSNKFLTNNIERKIVLTPPDYPEDMFLSSSGLFSAKPMKNYNTNIKFSVTDNNNISHTRSIPFKTYGLTVDFFVNAGGDTSIHAGDTVFISAKIKNISNFTVLNSNMKLESSDTNIIITDNYEFLGNINANDSITVLNAFKFYVKNNVLDGHFIDFKSKIITANDTFQKDFSYRVNAFLLSTGTVTVVDGNNNTLEPGETAALMLEIKNIGGATATNLTLNVSSSNPYINLNPNTSYIDTIKPYSSKNAFFIISVSPSIPQNQLIVINANISGSNNYQYKTYFFIQMGSIMEDFETNNFSKFNWTHAGNLNWFTSDSLKYQGNYSAKSGKITHSQTSSLIINQYVLSDGFIKFHRKVSCERDNTNHNYDYLAFYIDGVEKGRWDGEMDWSQETFAVSAGNRTFKWSYVKDYSVSTGADCAWLDNIIFPVFGDANPNIVINPAIINKTIEINTIDTAEIHISNAGNAMVLYENALKLNNGSPVNWASLNSNIGGINANSQEKIVVQFDGTLLQTGTYNCNLVINQNFIQQTTVPVYLTVMDYSNIKDFDSDFEIKCFPNPFNNSTEISINLKTNSYVTIEITDIYGRKLSDIINSDNLSAGNHKFKWNASNFSEGIYFCKVNINNRIFSYKLILTK